MLSAQLSAYNMNALSYSSSGVKTDTIGDSFSQHAHLNATSSDSYVVISNDQTVQGKAIDGDAHVHHTLTDAVDIPDNTFWTQDGADDSVDQTQGSTFSFSRQTTADEPVSRRRRTRFNEYQLRQLERAFNESHYLLPKKRRILSQRLGIPDEVVKNWFKNRRVRWRKENHPLQGHQDFQDYQRPAVPCLYHYGYTCPHPVFMPMSDPQMLSNTYRGMPY